jgi:hypothetical protein
MRYMRGTYEGRKLPKDNAIVAEEEKSTFRSLLQIITVHDASYAGRHARPSIASVEVSWQLVTRQITPTRS